MDLVTFATRVCKVMGVETIIGACVGYAPVPENAATALTNTCTYSYQCSRRLEPGVQRRGYRVLE